MLFPKRSASEPRSIWCVGRNFADHAAELGHPAPQERPILFLKSGACLDSGEEDWIPPFDPRHLVDLQPEVECVLRVVEEQGQWTFDAVAVGLDWTARGIQNQAKSQGHPWTPAKSFSRSVSVGAWSEVSPEWVSGGKIQELSLLLETFEQDRWVRRTQGDLRLMTFSPNRIIEELRGWAPLQPGDWIFMGTPKGVVSVSPRTILRARLVNRGDKSVISAQSDPENEVEIWSELKRTVGSPSVLSRSRTP